MAEINQRLAEIENQLLRLQLRCKQLEDVQEATNLVLAWLLDRHPRDHVLRYLNAQITEFQKLSMFEEDVALLEHLRELLVLRDAVHERDQ